MKNNKMDLRCATTIFSLVLLLTDVVLFVAAAAGGFGDFAGFDVNPDVFLRHKPSRRYGGKYYKPYSKTGPNYGSAGVKYGYKDGYGKASIIPYGGHSYGQKSSYQYGVIDEDKKHLKVPDDDKINNNNNNNNDELAYVQPTGRTGLRPYGNTQRNNGLLQNNRQQAYSYKLGYGYTESKNYGLKGVGTLNNRDVASDAGYEAGYDQTKQLAPKSFDDSSTS